MDGGAAGQASKPGFDDRTVSCVRPSNAFSLSLIISSRGLDPTPITHYIDPLPAKPTSAAEVGYG
jgi:hypothetical protein